MRLIFVDYLRCLTASAIALFVSVIQADAAPNSMSRLGVLYANGHPETGELGELYSMAASESGFLFVSFYSLSNPNGPLSRELHTWNLRNPSNPQLINRLDLSDPGSRAAPADSSFLVPRDMMVVKDHLVFWRNFELYTYKIGSTGGISLTFKSDFGDDLNPDLNRFSRGGGFVASERQLLTNNEFLQLVDQVGVDVASDLIAEQVLISVQNPEAPFLVAQTQGIGKDLRTFDPAPNGSYEGLPALVSLEDEGQRVSLVTLTQSQDDHLGQFWTPVLQQIFRRGFLNRSLRSLAGTTVRSIRPNTLLTEMNARIRRSVGFTNGRTLSAQLSSALEEEALLSSVLAQYGIALDDSVEFAVEKVVDSLISTNLENNLQEFLGRRLLNGLLEILFQRVPRSGREITRTMQAAFDGRLERLGLDRYLVNVVLSPLVELPPVFRKSLRQVITDLAQTSVGEGVTSALGVFNQFVPVRAAFRAAQVEIPRCYTIPETASEFLRVLVTSGGPKLKLDNLALFEFIKLAAHYRGDTDYGRLLGRVRSSIRTLHRTVSSDLMLTLFRKFDIGASLTTSTAQLLSKARATVSLRPILVRALAARIVQELATGGVETSGTVRAALEARGLFVEANRLPENTSLATNAGLIGAMNAIGVGQETLGSLIRIDSQAGLQELSAELERAAGRLFERLFGSRSLERTLSEAILGVISRELKPQSVGAFVEGLLGDSLTNLGSSIPLPSVIDTAVRASRGNCIANYQLALLALSPVPLVGEAAVVAQAALAEAQEVALDFIVQQLMSNFFSQVFESAGRDYPSWNLKLLTSTSQVSLVELTGRTVRFVDTLVEGDRVGILLRDLNASGWNPTLSREVDLVTFNPSDIAGTRSTIGLGAWDAVRGHVTNPNGYLLVVGDRLDAFELPQAAVSITKFVSQGEPPLELVGDEVSALSSATQLEVIGTNKLFAVRNAGGTITLLGRSLGRAE